MASGGSKLRFWEWRHFWTVLKFSDCSFRPWIWDMQSNPSRNIFSFIGGIFPGIFLNLNRALVCIDISFVFAVSNETPICCSAFNRSFENCEQSDLFPRCFFFLKSLQSRSPSFVFQLSYLGNKKIKIMLTLKTLKTRNI